MFYSPLCFFCIYYSFYNIFLFFSQTNWSWGLVLFRDLAVMLLYVSRKGLLWKHKCVKVLNSQVFQRHLKEIVVAGCSVFVDSLAPQQSQVNVVSCSLISDVSIKCSHIKCYMTSIQLSAC